MSFFTDRKLIGGHRGSPLKAKENTVISFETAINEGVDFIEFDIRSSLDNRLIVHHDPSVSGFILSEMTIKEIKALKNEIGYEIPLLEEVIELCSGKVMLDAEIKEEKITAQAIKMLAEQLYIQDFIVTSFYPDAILTAKNLFPEISRGILLKNELPGNIFEVIDLLCPHFLLPHHSIYINEVKTVCEQTELKAIPYTVNNEKEMVGLLTDPFIAGIITDKTETALSIDIEKII